MALLIPGVVLVALLAHFLPREAKGPSETVDPATTGTANGSPELIPSNQNVGVGDANAIRGVPDVIDTTTLKIGEKVVRLEGVEWARGGNADDLRSYLGGREVVCEPTSASPTHRCQVVGGRDLSTVVLFNGGARAAPQAPPDLRAAEQHARSEGVGVWKR